MEKIFLLGISDIFQGLVNEVQAANPDVKVQYNFEQVLGMAKLNELGRLCIFINAYNYSGSDDNRIWGQQAAEEIHKADPTVPILIWNRYTQDEKGNDVPVRLDNELYLCTKNYADDDLFLGIIKKFFAGTLTGKDIPKRECLNLNKEIF